MNIFDRYYVKLVDSLEKFVISQKMHSGYSREFAEDMISEGFLRLIQHGKDFKRRSELAAFVNTIAFNLTFNELQKLNKGRKWKQDLLYIQEGFENHSSHRKKRDLNDLFKYAIKGDVIKGGRRKLIFYLTYFQLMTTEAIALKLGISPQTVLNHKTFAFNDIRKHQHLFEDLVENY